MEAQKTSENGLKEAQLAVVMVPFPAQGHLNQALHLSHLIASYGMTVHYLASDVHNRQAKLRLHGRDLEKSSSKIHFHDLKLPPFSSPPPDPYSGTLFPGHLDPVFHASLQLRQPVSQIIQQLSKEFEKIVVIHDSLMASVVQDVKSIPNAEAYTFVSISAFIMFVSIWEDLTDKSFELDSDVLPRSIPSFEGCFTAEFEKFADCQHECLDFQSGALYDTSRVIEGKYVELLERLQNNADVKFFAIGPLNPVVKHRSEESKHGCLKWLDKQEAASVIYVSFGSTTSMTDEQIRELALGLENSGQKFIWVLRNADRADIFTDDHQGRKLKLPEGYEERVKDRGLVIRDWAPQLEILAHPSTGGFMSHCGWNSCLESITMGVPIAAWPMHSDQPRNSVLVTEVLKIGILVREWENRAELVKSSTLESVIRRLMASEEGAEMRKRAAELGEKVEGSIAEGGASRLEMDGFIAHITDPRKKPASTLSLLKLSKTNGGT